MFYDERIEYEKGIISRNCIIVSMITAIVMMIPRLLNIILYVNAYLTKNYTYYFNVATEAAILLSGTVCLIAGALYRSFGRNDELKKIKKSMFYSKAGVVHMYIALSGFAISCASLANQGTLDSSFLEIFFTFVIVIFSCCAYSFKKHDIFFNYSIMEDEHYYKKVFINVGKLAVNMFIFMTISLSANILISINTVTRNSWHAMLSIFSTYTYVFIILALAYIIYSYLEKSSYDNESFSLSYAPFITLIISVVLSLISLIFYLKVSSPYLTEETAFITGILNNMCTVCLVAFATYFSYEIQKERKNLAAKTGELIYILSISISSVLNSFFASVHHLIFQVTVQHNHNHSEETKEIFQNIKKLLFDQTNIMEITNDIVAAAQFLSVIILISILIKKGFISEKHYLICAVIFFICTADIISRNIFNVYDDASNLFKISIFKCIVFIGMIVYCAAVVFNISRKKRNNALKEE